MIQKIILYRTNTQSSFNNDGALGLQLLEDKGGLIFVKSDEQAFYNAITKHTVYNHLTNQALLIEKIFDFLMEHFSTASDNQMISNPELNEIKKILILLRNQVGHDFSMYKPNTIFRRIHKRINALMIDNITAYLRYIQETPNEIEILFNELLINVTHFFRDPAAFDTLKNILLAKFINEKPQDYCFRVWISGCSTGEEAYSIAILLQECMEETNYFFNVQIFGTDIDANAIDIARAGIYPASFKENLSPERLQRFFTKEGDGYKISPDIRKIVIFAIQNIIKDPPFTRLDLLCCRNLLIYLNAPLQKKIIPLFQYSLKHSGILFLGSSENIGGSVDLFNTLDRKWKIFSKKEKSATLQTIISFSAISSIQETTIPHKMETTMPTIEPKLSQLIEKILLEDYAPACVIVNEKNDIVYIHGKTSQYLEFAAGDAQLNVINMVRHELKDKLSTAIRKAISQDKEIIYDNLQIKDDATYRNINLKIKPIIVPNHSEKLLLVIFEEAYSAEPLSDHHKKTLKKGEPEKKMLLLEQELKYTKESLQTTIEELETSNEELKSSNEELQSINEELQSTNEELETSKEELQSLNEELSTVNSELENRIEQLSSANDDIKNLLDNTEIATVFFR